MALLDRFKRQKAYYWRKTGTDIEGKPTYAPVVIIRCRWEEKQQTFLEQRREDKEVSNSQVFTDNLLVLGDALKKVDDSDVKNKLTDSQLIAKLPSPTIPYDNESTWQVRQVGEQPNIKATKYLRWVLL